MNFEDFQKISLEQYESLKEQNDKLKKELKTSKTKLKEYARGANLDSKLIDKLQAHLARN